MGIGTLARNYTFDLVKLPIRIAHSKCATGVARIDRLSRYRRRTRRTCSRASAAGSPTGTGILGLIAVQVTITEAITSRTDLFRPYPFDLYSSAIGFRFVGQHVSAIAAAIRGGLTTDCI